MSSIKVGFIGLGALGMPLAKCLVKRGFPVTVYDLRESAVAEMGSLGAAAAGTCREVAAASDVVISMVRDIPQTDEVIFGKDGVWEGIKEGGTIILTSTLSSAYCQELYARAKERGVHVIDAPVTGTRTMEQAEEGEVTLMVGGDEDTVKQCWPVFEALGGHVFYLGGIGKGQAAKLIVNLLAVTTGAATRECLNFGLKAGLDLRQMIGVMSESVAYNWNIRSFDYIMMSMKRVSEVYPPGQAPSVSLGTKDRQYAVELAKVVGANIPVAQFTAELDMQSLYDAYAEAHSALMR